MSDTPPAGWYPDPQDGTRQRYWDGNAWTEHTAGGEPQAQASPGAVSAPARSDPDTWTWQSIVVTILCCAPFGVAGALNAGRAEQAIKSGDTAAATTHAKQAKKWTLWGLGVWAVLIVGYVAFMFLIVGLSEFDQF